MAYATVEDLEARWRTLDSDERAVAEALLADAAAYIDAWGTPSSAQAALVVSCNMVKRSMAAAGTDAFGVGQASMTAGSYQQQWTYANPSGDMYITKAEKKLLGFGGTIGFARPAYGVLEVDDDD